VLWRLEFGWSVFLLFSLSTTAEPISGRFATGHRNSDFNPSARISRFDIQLGTELAQTFLHPPNPDARTARLNFCQTFRWNSFSFIADLDVNVTVLPKQSDAGFSASRMPMDIRQALLHKTKKRNSTSTGSSKSPTPRRRDVGLHKLLSIIAVLRRRFCLRRWELPDSRDTLRYSSP
jgi:hypothetical protein